MVTGKDIPDADTRLFRSSVGEVTRIKHDFVEQKPRKPAPVPRQRIADEQAVIRSLAESPFTARETNAGDELYFKRPGIQQRVMEKLRRGQFTIEKELDLHGMTVADADAALKRFLSFCRRNGYQCIRIIHGKGHGSRDRKPVIKNMLNQWLQKNNQILAFCSARSADGGTGAVYVLLKK